MDELLDLSASQIAAAVRTGRASATGVTEAALARIAERDPQVHSFVHVDEQAALAQAGELDRQIAEGDPAGPLAGVPVPIKDLTMVAGMPMQAGSAALQGFVPEHDDGTVTRIKEAGGIVVGKTATPELGLPPYTETDIAPPPINPWDATRSPGGSSGGAGAAVAAGLTPLAHGSDGGGSIRIPAGALGLVGLKPSRGRISTGPYGVDGPALASQGVLTHTVADTALGLDVLSAGWPGDDRLVPTPPGGFVAALKTDGSPRVGPLRVGVVIDPFIGRDTEIHPGALAAVERATGVLMGLGHTVTPVGVPFEQEDWDPFLDVWSVMAAQAPIPEEAEELLVPLSRWMRARGREVSGTTYAGALANGQMLHRRVAAAWAQTDVILSPTLAWPAAKIGSIRNDADPYEDFIDQCRYTPWTSTWNILGAPAISVPLHSQEVDGVELPFGIMLGARTNEDALLLRLAADLEDADPWAGRRAPML